MIHLGYFYGLLALLIAYTALRNLRERRWRAAGFWAVTALLIGSGDWVLARDAAGDPLPAQCAGVAVLLLAVLAPGMQRPALAEAPLEQRLASARRLGHRLFVPALLIPLITVLVVIAGKWLTESGLIGADDSVTLIGLSLASVIAVLVALRMGRAPLPTAAREGRRLLDTMGWAALLPLVLATLGGVFAASGVGDAVSALVTAVIPSDSRVACVLAYGLGMVLFTVIMGNAFAAFPVMTAGIGLPLLIHEHGANAAILGSLGMLTGYCGTLLTPMAANFNLVPVALLELDDPYAVIRAQLPTALGLMAVNLLLMYWLIFAF
ncbi:DUF979 domain-containing protein [Solimonas marina]|uniref:DUF979 domain-containing protein n=1 Tax=Solimonas marina TaxID=2714601 RepID=A0A969WBV9_9GAMM|nr:DUF979 domain-containing protein [Solimonas marina]NKF23329.1 DUF979 domain-containing protein [Solimonas marina]